MRRPLVLQRDKGLEGSQAYVGSGQEADGEVTEFNYMEQYYTYIGKWEER